MQRARFLWVVTAQTIVMTSCIFTKHGFLAATYCDETTQFYVANYNTTLEMTCFSLLDITFLKLHVMMKLHSFI